MITEDHVSFEVAKLLKEKGFDEATNRYYNAQHDQIRTVSDTFMWHWNNEEFMKSVLMDGAIAIPTLQMAMKWLREVHNIFIQVELYSKRNDYCFEIFKNTHNLIVEKREVYNSFESACENAIGYVLNNIL